MNNGSGNLAPAGFWVRSGALGIDLFLILLVYSQLRQFEPFAYPLIFLAYSVALTASLGATPGKLVAGIRIVTVADAQPVGPVRMTARTIFFLVSLGIGSMFANSPPHRGLQDHLARTRVIYPRQIPDWRIFLMSVAGLAGICLWGFTWIAYSNALFIRHGITPPFW